MSQQSRRRALVRAIAAAGGSALVAASAIVAAVPAYADTTVPGDVAVPEVSVPEETLVPPTTPAPEGATEVDATSTPEDTAVPEGVVSPAAVSPSAAVVINEVYGGGGNANAPFSHDFVELRNVSAATVDLTGWSVQYASATGSTWNNMWTLSGGIEPGGFLLLQGDSNAAVGAPLPNPDFSATVAMGAGAGKVALVNTTTQLTGSTGHAALPQVVDLVGFGSTASSYAGAGPTPAPSATTSVSRNAASANTANNNVDFTVSNPPTPQGGGGTVIEPGQPELKTIAEIQGATAGVSITGPVTTRGVVTAKYATGGFNGYVIQTPGTGGTATTGRTASDAIFVFSSATVGAVNIGNYVEVTGTAGVFQGLGQITVAAGGVTVLTETVTAPTPLQMDWPATEAERQLIASMLIQPPGEYTISNTYSTNQYGEVGLALGDAPLMQPTHVARPGTQASVDVAADNAARGVVFDDGTSINYLAAANQSLTPPFVSLSKPIRVGATVEFTKPVIVDWRNNVWKLNPTGPLSSTAPADYPVTWNNTRTAAPQDVGGDITVASFNVLNYFTTLGENTPGCTSYNDRQGNPVTVNSGCNPRGAWHLADFQRQQTKIVEAINALDASVIGLMEIENSAKLGEAPDEATATLVAALNADAGAGTWDYVRSSADLPPVNQQDVITNAIIYQPAEVTPEGASRALGTQSGSGQPFVNAREPIAQEFVPVGGDAEDSITVVVNHFKSKGSAGPFPDDADTGDGQGASNGSRVRQATALAAWVDTITDDGDAVALVGDFNSYGMEDPLEVLYQQGYTNAEAELEVETTSYSFGGMSGSLDHVILNEAALDRATDADIWNINSGESIALEYSRFNSHGTLFHADDPYRSSDHDPVIVGLTVGDAEPDGNVNLSLLNINDFHGRIGPAGDGATVQFAGTVEEQRKAIEDAGGKALFLSAGDNIGASLFTSSVAEDQPTIDVLNVLELASSAVGNHEFDRGFDDLVDRVIDEGANAEWAYLGANVYDASGSPVLPEYSLHTLNGQTVGVIGVVTEETPALVSPGGITGLTFGDPVAAVNRVAAQLTDGNPANGEADIIVAEYHEGAGAGIPDGSSLEQEVAHGGAFADIVNNTSAAVDVIFTGHTHKQYAWDAPVPGEPDKTRPILQTGSYGEYLGRVDLTYDPVTDEVVLYRATNVARTTTAEATLVSTFPRVADVKEIVGDAIAYASVVGSRGIGSVTADITTAFTGGRFVNGKYVGPGPLPTTGRDDRASESALGNLVADSLVSSLSSAERGGATIGVVNPGGLRAELFRGATSVVTYAQANAVLPFVNNLWTTTLTGAQFKTMLEQQWQRDAQGNVPSRPYLQLGLSSNVSYTFDATRPEGDRITSITIDGAQYDPAAEYRIGSFSFLLQGGDNFRILTQGTDTRDSGLVDRDAWIEYVGANSPLSPDFGRVATAVPALDPVLAGDEVTFTASRLDLTSIGSPQNTVATVQLGSRYLGTFAVSGGSAAIDVVIPAGTPAGAHQLTITVAPSGTIITVPLTVKARQFVDVPPGTQFYDEIMWLAAEGISTGYADGTFRPVTPVNRDAMAAFLYRLAGSPDYTPPATSPFLDVATDNMFYTEIAWLAEEGISTGWSVMGGREFRPLQPVNRDAMAAFLYRFAGTVLEMDVDAFVPPTTSPFKDVTTSTQFYREIAWLADEGISTGWSVTGGKEFRPVTAVNRDAMAAFMYRLMHLE